jgi:hypothetical protein
MAKISSLTRWNGVRRSSFLNLVISLALRCVQIHNTIHTVQFAFNVLTCRTSANGKGKFYPRTGHKGLEGEK